MMMQMNAAILTKANTPFRVESVSVDPPQADEALIKIAASGVCRSDWRVAIGTAPKPMPIITGHEGAGVVKAVGPGVTRVEVGDHVALSWAPGCGDCFYCHNHKSNLCESYRQLLASGLQADGKSRIRWNDQAVYILAGLGTFAEYAVVRQESCLPIRRDVPLEAAALAGCAVATGVGAAMYSAGVRPGQSAAVFGAGGIGLNIIQGAALSGANPIIAVDISSAKMEIAREFGATHAIMSDESAVARIKELTSGRGVDCAFEALGLPSLQERAFAAVRPGGQLTLVGTAPADSSANLPGAIITRAEKVVRGSSYGSVNPRRDIPALLDLYLAGMLKLDELITRRYRLEQINEAYADMLSGDVARGVIVF